MKTILDEVEKGTPSTPESIEIASSVELDRRFTYPRFKPTKSPDLQELSESDLESLNAVISQFGSKSFTELRAITHEMPAYDKAWSARAKPNQAWMHFEDFFQEDEGSLAGTHKEMLENDALRKAFPDPAWL